MRKRKCEPCDLAITRVREGMRQDIDNIGARKGITISAWLRKELRDVADSFPSDMKVSVACDPPAASRFDIRIQHMRPETMRELQNIADNIGVDVSSLVKIELAKRIRNMPAWMKEKMLED